VLRAKQATGLVEARVLGTLLAEAVMGSPGPRPDVLIPVPLSRRRLIRRGHNQAVLIAEPVSRLLGIPLSRYGVRRRSHTPILPGLSPEERLRSVAGAFHCASELDGMTVAIIDDVVTTGATAGELAACLAAAGAQDIQLFAATCATAPTGGTATL
jgi:ComF family protein